MVTVFFYAFFMLQQTALTSWRFDTLPKQEHQMSTPYQQKADVICPESTRKPGLCEETSANAYKTLNLFNLCQPTFQKDLHLHLYLKVKFSG